MNRLTAYAARFLRTAETKRPNAPPARAEPYSYDHDLLEEIKRIGFHPFILVRVGESESADRQFVTCRTQNEAAEFVVDLAKIPYFAESKLIRAIERALQLETYEAADLLFGWAQETTTPLTE